MEWRNVATISWRGSASARVIFQIAALGTVCFLSACRIPFSDKLTRIDWSGPPAAGTIAISQPKMYRRESLLDEQRSDITWLKALLESSPQEEFAPEIVRETEQITTFATALGLSFDPAGAAQYKRNTVTGDLQHEFDVLKLQLQLDQLRRDAELVREKFATQTIPVNSVVGAPGDSAKESSGAARPAAEVTSAALEKLLGQLNDAVVKLQAQLTTRLSANTGKPGASAGAVSPGDLLRDRLALRGMIKAALAAANLDDLHDYGGSALIRLDFQAMVLPDRERSRVPGVIQMQVVPPVLTDDEWNNLYRGWLDHINLKINRVTDSGWEPDPALASLADAGMFTLAHYYYPREPMEAGTHPCNGIARQSGELDRACGRLVIATPQLKGFSVQEGAFSTFDAYFSWLGKELDQDPTQALHALILRMGAAAVRDCGLPERPPDAARSAASELYEGIRKAKLYVAVGDEMLKIDHAARRFLDRDRQRRLPGLAGPYRQRIASARFILRTFEQAVYGRCPADKLKAFRESVPQPYLPIQFRTFAEPEPRVMVYEVGPQEQAQRVSSVARVANSLSMALSLAAAAPAAGRNASAAASYSRQALGRADAVERVPALIGYAADDKRFGWVITPRAVFEAKGDLALEQVARTLDLSVRLSIPGWWPRLTILPKTGWGLDARSITSGDNAMQARPKIHVLMVPNYADYEEITARLQRNTGPGERRVELDDKRLKKQSVAACHETNLYIRGANIWRATEAAVGSRKLDDTAIKVAPDMSGVLLTVPALGEQLGATRGEHEQAAMLPFTIFTRYGNAQGEVAYAPAPSAGCHSAGKSAGADKPATDAAKEKTAAPAVGAQPRTSP